MAWNDPPSFDYQQMTNPGRKFKNRYVLDGSNLGQDQRTLFQQPQQQYQQHNHQYQPPMINHISNSTNQSPPTNDPFSDNLLNTGTINGTMLQQQQPPPSQQHQQQQQLQQQFAPPPLQSQINQTPMQMPFSPPQ